MTNQKDRGRLTIPTDTDIVEDTLKVMEKWGADAIRDADGTEFPEELRTVDARIYATYYTTRKDNAWAEENPEEIQQCYIMTDFFTAEKETLIIPLGKGISEELIKINSRDDIKRWWEVVDRTTGDVFPANQWEYDEENETVILSGCMSWHEYTVSFLAYMIWDPVHMYNSITNDWKDTEHQMTFDVRQPKTRAFSMTRLRDYLKTHPYVDVVRFTTFFHQFTLIFDELKREKYVDWFGYSASVSPFILEQFEKEAGYPFRPEYIIDQGYYNNQYRIPTKEYLDFLAFQRKEVAVLAKELVDIVHQENREAMMFLGDHWIGMEPYMDEFLSVGLDSIVGSVGNGSTLRLISDIPGVSYKEGRFLPYFFPDVFCPEGDPVKEAKENWVTARRAILRSPIDRIGYGGYLKLALDFPDFMDYVEQVADEFRTLYRNVKGTTPYSFGKVAVLNSWGKMRSWGCHMVHHALYQKENYSYAGVVEALSGAPFDVSFINFTDIKENPDILSNIDVLINVGDEGTAHTGGDVWADPEILCTVRSFIANGGGFIGVGEPTAYRHQGHVFQLAQALGVEKETGFTLGYDKYNWEEKDHYILEDTEDDTIDFGEGKKGIYALPHTQVLKQENKEVNLAVHSYGKGRCVYISGLPYNFINARILHRALLWSGNMEDKTHTWFSQNCKVDVHAYEKNKKYCVVNNTDESQDTIVYTRDNKNFALSLKPNEIFWFDMD